RVIDEVDQPPPDVRMAQTIDRLAAGGDDLDLPARLSLFGHTRLARSEVRVLGALGQVRDVHLWLPQPSGRLWDALAELSAEGPVPRPDDPSARYVRHPLLASLGRDARELQRAFAEVEFVDHVVALELPAPTTLLERLQAD